MSDDIVHDPVPWWQARPRWRCLIGRHHAFTSGVGLDGELVQRCACSAFGPRQPSGRWVRIDPFPWRALLLGRAGRS